MKSSTAERQRLWERWRRTGRDSDRDAVIENCRRLVQSTSARGYCPSYVDRHDLEAALIITLVDCVDHYDPGYGASLESWVVLKLKRRIQDYYRSGQGVHPMRRNLSDSWVRYERAMGALVSRIGCQPSHEAICAEMGVDPDWMRDNLDERYRIIWQQSATFVLEDAKDGHADAYEELIDLAVPGPDEETVAGRTLMRIFEKWSNEVAKPRDAAMLRRVILNEETRTQVGKEFGLSDAGCCYGYKSAMERFKLYLRTCHAPLMEVWE